MASLAPTPLRLPRLLVALALGLVPACGDDKGDTTETTGPSTGTSSTTTETGTSGTSGMTAAVTETATSSPTGGMTGGETDGTTTAATTTTGEPLTTGTSGGETGETTTGGPVGPECTIDSDCELHSDCCTCDVQPKGAAAPECDKTCKTDSCSTLDLDTSIPVCRFGRCTFSKVTCNPLQVVCETVAPECPVGQLPTVSVDSQCWTGQCAPVEACDWVPGCEACLTDAEDPLVCVLKLQKGAFALCEPKPFACGDQAEIDCACGAEICEASPPHVLCQENDPGLACECPNC